MTKDNFQTARDEVADKYAVEQMRDDANPLLKIYCGSDFSAGADWAREFLSAEMDKLKQDNLLALDIGARFADERDDLRSENAKLREALSAVTSQDRTKGYPTGAEWRAVVDIIKTALGMDHSCLLCHRVKCICDDSKASD